MKKWMKANWAQSVTVLLMLSSLVWLLSSLLALVFPQKYIDFLSYA